MSTEKTLSWKNLIITDHGDLLKADFIDDTHYDYEYTLNNLKMCTTLQPTIKHRIFTEFSNSITASKKARELSGGYYFKMVTQALALFTTSSITKVTFNFFLLINKPSYPVRLFTSMDEAKEWLRSFPVEPITTAEKEELFEYVNHELYRVENGEIIKL